MQSDLLFFNYKIFKHDTDLNVMNLLTQVILNLNTYYP